MGTSTTKVPCPYCGEEIMAVAKKCKHCGEWLTKETGDRPGGGATDRGSVDARAVAKGLKEKELHDFGRNVVSAIVLIVSAVAGLWAESWAVFFIVLFIGILFNAWWYYRE